MAMRWRMTVGAVVALLGLAAGGARAAEVKVQSPLGRSAFQTNERIDLSVVRQSDKALTAGELELRVRGEDGGLLTFAFPVGKAEPEGGKARRVEHLHLNGWL